MNKENSDWLKNQLRRISYKWPARSSVLRAARVKRGIYRCAKCIGKFRAKEIQVDHIIPVVEPGTGFVNWDTYLERLFCDTHNLQVLCKECHAKKTVSENKSR